MSQALFDECLHKLEGVTMPPKAVQAQALVNFEGKGVPDLRSVAENGLSHKWIWPIDTHRKVLLADLRDHNRE